MLIDNIRRKCQERGISLPELEQATHIGNGVIARWTVSNPRVDNIVKVADYFGCTVDELLKKEEYSNG